MDEIKHRPYVDIHNVTLCALQCFLMHTTSEVEVSMASNVSLHMAMNFGSFVTVFASSISNVRKTCMHQDSSLL